MKSFCADGQTHWTPLHLDLMIHYYTTPVRLENAGASAVIEYTADLEREGLIVKHDQWGSGWKATRRGEAFVKLLCRTPLPVERWCTPDGKMLI